MPAVKEPSTDGRGGHTRDMDCHIARARCRQNSVMPPQVGTDDASKMFIRENPLYFEVPGLPQKKHVAKLPPEVPRIPPCKAFATVEVRRVTPGVAF